MHQSAALIWCKLFQAHNPTYRSRLCEWHSTGLFMLCFKLKYTLVLMQIISSEILEYHAIMFVWIDRSAHCKTCPKSQLKYLCPHTNHGQKRYLNIMQSCLYGCTKNKHHFIGDEEKTLYFLQMLAMWVVAFRMFLGTAWIWMYLWCNTLKQCWPVRNEDSRFTYLKQWQLRLWYCVSTLCWPSLLCWASVHLDHKPKPLSSLRAKQ